MMSDVRLSVVVLPNDNRCLVRGFIIIKETSIDATKLSLASYYLRPIYQVESGNKQRPKNQIGSIQQHLLTLIAPATLNHVEFETAV